MSGTLYIESKLDNKSYCKTNGQFTRHLKHNNLSYQEYFETYISGFTPLCTCYKPLAFYQKTESYANSCGDVTCVGKSVSATKQSWTIAQKEADSNNKKKAALSKTDEQKKQQKEKAKQTFIKKYGVEWSSKSEIQKEKSRQSKLKKYGTGTYNNSAKSAATNRSKTVIEQNLINDARRKTNLMRYGIENILLRPGILSKSQRSNSVGKQCWLPSGNIVHVRGYEGIVILNLLCTYLETDLICHDMNSNYKIPVFEFVNANLHSARYYPDIYIPKENRIIEVKSRWWWDANGDTRYANRLVNNLKKRQAVLDKGYNYEVWLFSSKINYTILKNDSDFQT